jgi:hypothetical protein
LKKYAPFSEKWGNFAYWDLWLRIYQGEGDVFIYNPQPTWNYCLSPNSLHIKRQKETPEFMKQYNEQKFCMLTSHTEPVEPVKTVDVEIAEKKPIDIVFPYAIEGNVMDELKYALRSIEQNFKDPYRIVIVGDAPDWLNQDNVLYIPHKRETGKNSKLKDSVVKMKLICEHPDISTNFIYWYDDIYLLQLLGTTFFSLSAYYKNVISDDFTGKTINQKYLKNTADCLREEDSCKTIFNGECHIPRMFNKYTMYGIIEKYSPLEEQLLINTLYLNKTITPLFKLYKSVKAGFYGFDGNDSELALSNVDQQVAKSIFLNHDDNGLNNFLKDFIRNTWNVKCKCEK